MTHTTHNRSRIMRLSWEIQKNSNSTRGKALTAAWAFFANEKILVQYLIRGRKLKPGVLTQYSLFRA
jgi:hypothetical protein